MSGTDTAVQMVNVQVDGNWMQFPKGTRLIEACLKTGHDIPHYCYHPKLSVPGNCRMCLVELGMPKMGPDRKPITGPDGFPEINWIPRPTVSCATEVSEGMAVRTDSPMVQECRKGVMEFLLINHPLDCPICDQAGECRLQEYSVQYGKGDSRFLDEKVKKPKRVDIGERIVLDDERCIMCSRCIRFMQEVAHDDVLGFLDRGSHTTLAVHPGKRLDSNYSLNTVDICPVGALTSKDFRFKMRVWFLKETKSIDVNCGTGCNIVIGSRENVIYRITPRENDFVNSCWIPDSHRLNFHYLYNENRLVAPKVRHQGKLQEVKWEQALRHAVSEWAVLQSGIAMIASARMTNEELYLAKRLASVLGIELIEVLPRPQQGDGFLVSDDGNPNTNGAKLLGVTGEKPGAKLVDIGQRIADGRIKGLICLGEDPVKCGIDETELGKLNSLVVMDILPNKAMGYATVVLPAAGFAEKRGTMINIKQRIQRLNCAVQPPGQARDDWEILRDLIRAVEGTLPGTVAPGAIDRSLEHSDNGRDAHASRNQFVNYTIEDVFRDMASDVPALAGLTIAKVGDLGVQLEGGQ